MQFCSKYGYDYGNLSDEEEFTELQDHNTSVTHGIRKADSNVIGVSLSQLKNLNEIHAGEPIMCTNCGAIVSIMSKESIKKTEDGKCEWTCEYCEKINDITNILDDMNEIPTKDEVTYILDKGENSTRTRTNDDSYLILAIDVSGSMNSSIKIKKPNRQIPGEFTYERTEMSRLQGVKLSAAETLKHISETEPDRRVALLTFSDDLKLYSDSTKKPIFAKIKPEHLSSTSILELAANFDGEIRSISKTHTLIDYRLRHLNSESDTALGPALLYSVGLASKMPGSSVILCTDGIANVGVGSVCDYKKAEVKMFYDFVADYAKLKSVTVNIITMEGTDCKLAFLGHVAHMTNGSVSIVNPKYLSDELKWIVENKIIATNVKAKLIVNHKYLYIRDDVFEAEEAKAIDSNNFAAKMFLNDKKLSISIKDIGNANIDTDISFEYGVKRVSQEDQIKKPDVFLFQLQLYYTANDGTKGIRVFTKQQKFTKDRLEAEKNILAPDFLYMHGMHKSTKQVLLSNIAASKFCYQANYNLLQRNSITSPELYKTAMDRVSSFTRDQRSYLLSDNESESMFGCANMSRLSISSRSNRTV